MYEQERRYSRVDTLLNVTLSDGKKTAKECIHTAGKGGVMIKSKVSWDIGTLLYMAIKAHVLIKARGKVVWVLRDADAYNIGVEFETLSAEAARAWDEVLSRGN